VKSSLPRRRLIPRWRPASKTLATSEIESVFDQPSKKLVFDRHLFDDSVRAWRSDPTAGHLGDVLAFSPDTELRPAIEAILAEAKRLGHALSDTQRSIFSDLREELGDPDDTHIGGRLAIQARVAALRKELLVAPENVLALLDLAQLQLAAGKQTAARRLLFTALNLAPNGRIVLRTAARFFVHVGEHDRAHSLITRHPATKEDPWLMASEIALAEIAGRDSALLNVARRIIRTSNRSSRQLAELAGVMASRELREGSLKEARSHLRLALEQPTDNVVAQAMMDARQMGVKLDEPAIVQAVTRSAEAQLLQAWMAADELAAEAHALRWHAEEPFSSRPLQFLTALYALQGEYDKALAWVHKGLIADPADVGLITNLSFAQAAVGDETMAEASIKRARSLGTAGLEPFFKATEGLIALRRKEFDIARTLYREAEQAFLKDGRESIAALCVAHYAKFAAEYGATDADPLRQEAQQKVEKAPTIDGLIMLGKLQKTPVTIPADEEEQRRLSQWVFDPGSNTLTQRLGVTAKGAPAIVVQPAKPPSGRKP
jgi:tetratricopeptide (TPR) repeat protein